MPSLHTQKRNASFRVGHETNHIATRLFSGLLTDSVANAGSELQARTLESHIDAHVLLSTCSQKNVPEFPSRLQCGCLVVEVAAYEGVATAIWPNAGTTRAALGLVRHALLDLLLVANLDRRKTR